MEACIKIERESIAPKADIRVLRLQIDTKLKWGPHVRKIQEKMSRQLMALSKISTSTWGATFAKARQVYTAVVRPAMTYGSSVWHTPSELKDTSKSLINKMSIMQNKCLRVISGAYRATSVRVLKAETQIASMRIHLDQLQAQARCRLLNDGQALLIRRACKRIKGNLQDRTGPRREKKETPGNSKQAWLTHIVPKVKIERGRLSTLHESMKSKRQLSFEPSITRLEAVVEPLEQRKMARKLENVQKQSDVTNTSTERENWVSSHSTTRRPNKGTKLADHSNKIQKNWSR